MCGIAGIWKFDGSPVDPLRVQQMTATLSHRGPDAMGCYVEGPVGLGHTRLAIIDLIDASNQPFHSADGRYVLSYNGEVFNYVELRDELIDLGVQFRTHGDTEVVLAAYIQWGEDCVQRFNGMWAFAIHDQVQDKLFCSRDRFGIKPFVYAIHEGCFVFASEAKAILEIFPELRVPNYDVISYCVRQSLAAGLENTCFAGIMRLLPSHCLRVTADGVSKSKFWDYPTHVDRSIDKTTATRKIAELLDDAVRIRMRSDVTIGLTLSSGVDSTAIARLMRNHSQETMRAFTSCYESEYRSEVTTASETAKALNFEFSPVLCTARDFNQRLRQIVRHVETPHSSPAMMALWEIMKFAAPGTKVMLEGQGADELFAGYPTIYFGYAARQALRQGRLGLFFQQLWGAWRTTKEHPIFGSHYFFSGLLRACVPGAHKLIRRFGRGDESVYIGPLKNVPDYLPDFDRRVDDILNRKLKHSHQVDLVELLHYGDAISMAHSIESRMPFMDFRLIEYVFQLPAEFKFINGKAKQILREALVGMVPQPILDNQKKLGFVTPISEWLRKHPAELIEAILLTPKCEARGIFDMAKVRQIVDKHLSGRRDYGALIFRWLTTEIWFQEFIDTPATQASDRALDSTVVSR